MSEQSLLFYLTTLKSRNTTIPCRGIVEGKEIMKFDSVLPSMLCIGILVFNGYFASSLSLEYSRQLLKIITQNEGYLVNNPLFLLSELSISIAIALGCLICWFPLQYLGRRSTLELLSAPFSILGCILTFTFHHLMQQSLHDKLSYYSDVILFIGICLQGLSYGFLTVASPIYILETVGKVTCASSIGILLLSTQTSTTCGLLLANIFPVSSETHFLHLISPAFNLTSLVGFYFLPESPRWLLLRKKRVEDAKHALQMLDHNNMKYSEITSYLQQLSKDYQKFKETVTIASYLHPLLIVVGLTSTWYLYGMQLYEFYASWTIKFAGISLKWKLDPLLLSLSVRFSSLSILTTMYLIIHDITFHTTFLLFASGIATLSLIGTGFCFYGFEEDTTWILYLCWLPLATHFLFQIAFWLGPGSQLHTMAVVVSPPSFRPSILSIGGAIFWLGNIFSSRLIIPMISILHPFGAYWFFAAMSAITLLFFLFTVFPEIISNETVNTSLFNDSKLKDKMKNQINTVYSSSEMSEGS